MCIVQRIFIQIYSYFTGTCGTVVKRWTAMGEVEGSNPGRDKTFFQPTVLEST